MSNTVLVLGRQGLPACAARAQTLGAGDPFGAGRQVAFHDEAGFSTGHVDLAGEIVVASLAHAEVIVLVAGGLSFAEERFAAGDALVLPKGFSGTVSLAAGTRWFFCAITAGDKGAETTAIRLNPGLPRADSPGPAEAVLIGPKPSCHSLNQFTDASGMRAGVWDVMTPCARTFVPHRVHELMHILSGAVTLTHQQGGSVTLAAGDTVFLPRGTPCAWTNEQPVVKYYVVL